MNFSTRSLASLGGAVGRAAFDFMASVKLAVAVILGLAALLATATVLESLYDTATARYYVYNSVWFYGLLAFLGINILFSALSRMPWKRNLLPFLLAHAGILTLLAGSWLTAKYGLDGTLRLAEGESSAAVEMDQPLLVLTEGGRVSSIPIQWVPPGVPFKPIQTLDYGLPYDLSVSEFISHADADFDFAPRPDHRARSQNLPDQPALQIKLIGGAMRIEQEFWLWTGDPGWAAYSAGPAWLEFKQAGGLTDIPPPPPHGPVLSLTLNQDGSLAYRARSSSGEQVSGRFSAKQLLSLAEKPTRTPQIGPSLSFDPHWRGGVRIEIKKWLPDAWVNMSYKPSRIQYGELAPPSAIHVKAGRGGDQAEVWLGIGTRAILRASGREVEIGYFRRRVILPFAVHLNRFEVKYYEGSAKPASYSSNVSVEGDPDSKQMISMNHPLLRSGVTLYQASYEDADPRPTVSILAVNQDPGRPAKYAGSLLIVLGTILLFAKKYRATKRKG